MSAESPGSGGMTDAERARLRRAFELLPKVEGHGDTALERHNDVLPEWIMQIIANPYRSDEVYTRERELRTVLTGRVSESRQWIMVVFVGDTETGRFLTAYHNKNLEKEYGGRPWSIP